MGQIAVSPTKSENPIIIPFSPNAVQFKSIKKLGRTPGGIGEPGVTLKAPRMVTFQKPSIVGQSATRFSPQFLQEYLHGQHPLKDKKQPSLHLTHLLIANVSAGTHYKQLLIKQLLSCIQMLIVPVVLAGTRVLKLLGWLRSIYLRINPGLQVKQLKKY